MPCTTAPNSGTLFFFNDTATTEIYTLSLHDALPICPAIGRGREDHEGSRVDPGGEREDSRVAQNPTYGKAGHPQHGRSEEHTSELQSQSNLVCRLLLEKKKETRLRPSGHAAAVHQRS